MEAIRAKVDDGVHRSLRVILVGLKRILNDAIDESTMRYTAYVSNRPTGQNGYEAAGN
ncbi:hypothetical protein NBRC116495_08230 [Aurantivibrio plasticivorans]